MPGFGSGCLVVLRCQEDLSSPDVLNTLTLASECQEPRFVLPYEPLGTGSSCFRPLGLSRLLTCPTLGRTTRTLSHPLGSVKGQGSGQRVQHAVEFSSRLGREPRPACVLAACRADTENIARLQWVRSSLAGQSMCEVIVRYLISSVET